MLSREHMYAHDRASGLTESALLEASDHSGEQRRLQQTRVRGGGRSCCHHDPISPFRSQQPFPTDRGTARQFYSLNHHTIHICITTQEMKTQKTASEPKQDLKE